MPRYENTRAEYGMSGPFEAESEWIEARVNYMRREFIAGLMEV